MLRHIATHAWTQTSILPKSLHFHKCPMLTSRLKPKIESKIGKYWHMVAHSPRIEIDDQIFSWAGKWIRYSIGWWTALLEEGMHFVWMEIDLEKLNLSIRPNIWNLKLVRFLHFICICLVYVNIGISLYFVFISIVWLFFFFKVLL